MRPSATLGLAALLFSCGPIDGTDTQTGGSSTTAGTGSTTGDTPTTGETPTTTGTTPTTGEAPTTTGDILCMEPGVSVGPPVEIQIRNGGDVRAYIDAELGCSPASPFKLTGPDDVTLKTDLGSFEFSCIEAANNECGRDPGCPIAGQVTQIDPGATFKTFWTGGFQVMAQLSEECADQLCGGCWIQEQAPAAPYIVRVEAGTTLMGCDGDCTPCEADADGTCVTIGARADEVALEAVLDYPNQSSIEFVIP